MDADRSPPGGRSFTAAEIGALAHLYRGEVYRSTLSRTRLDTTTNWSVVTLGVALSVTFSTAEASPVPLLLVGVLIGLFLMIEARRYRYFNVWRARARWLENHFYAPMLDDGDLHLEQDWQRVLARDYTRPAYHISYMTAVGRRLRNTYLWIFLLQTIAYLAKLAIHPAPLERAGEFTARAAIGSVPGAAVLGFVAFYLAAWTALAGTTYLADLRRRRLRRQSVAMG